MKIWILIITIDFSDFGYDFLHNWYLLPAKISLYSQTRYIIIQHTQK